MGLTRAFVIKAYGSLPTNEMCFPNRYVHTAPSEPKRQEYR